MSPEDLHELRQLLKLTERVKRSYASGCAGKLKFTTHAKADSAIRPKKRGLLNAYRCDHCGAWHIGGRKPARNLHRVQTFETA